MTSVFKLLKKKKKKKSNIKISNHCHDTYVQHPQLPIYKPGSGHRGRNSWHSMSDNGCWKCPTCCLFILTERRVVGLWITINRHHLQIIMEQSNKNNYICKTNHKFHIQFPNMLFFCSFDLSSSYTKVYTVQYTG